MAIMMYQPTSAKALRQENLDVFDKEQEGQCGWNRANLVTTGRR